MNCNLDQKSLKNSETRAEFPGFPVFCCFFHFWDFSCSTDLWGDLAWPQKFANYFHNNPYWSSKRKFSSTSFLTNWYVSDNFETPRISLNRPLPFLATQLFKPYSELRAKYLNCLKVNRDFSDLRHKNEIFYILIINIKYNKKTHKIPQGLDFFNIDLTFE